MKPLSIEEHVRRCLGPMQPVAVYLFGSAAAGSMRDDSDVDIAILPRDRIDPVLLFDKQTELAEGIGRDVDLVDLDRASTVFRKEVVHGGRLVLETDPRRRAEFEMYTLSDYARLNEERSPVLASFGVTRPDDD